MLSIFKNYQLPTLLVSFAMSLISANASELYGKAEPYQDGVSQEASMVVVFRDVGKAGHVPAIFVNDRVIGSLLPKTYAETLVCPGEIKLRVDTRSDKVLLGQELLARVKAGETVFVKVSDKENSFNTVQVSSSQASDYLKNSKLQSNVINRHIPKCGIPASAKQISVGADALFAFNSTNLLPEGQTKLDGLVKDIQTQNIQIQQLKIVGYTDRLGSDKYNDSLSLARANSVAQYLTQKGLSVPMVTEGRGKREPVVSNCVGHKANPQLIQCLQPNRRIAIEINGASSVQ
jgi:OOP family OmpA-OmpF porin